MKVLQILPELNAGGVERGTLEIARTLVEAGHEALVVSNGGRLVGELEQIGARHVTLPVHRKSLKSLFQVHPLRRLFEQEKPDIIHIRSRVPGWIAWLAWRGMNAHARPHLVSTVHGFYSVNTYSAIMTRGERVIAVSESIRDYILENYPKVPPDRIRVVPRGVQLEQYPLGFTPSSEWLTAWRASQPRCAGRAVLLLPGRITRLKGHEDFFNLISALKQQGLAVQGLIVGDTHAGKQDYMAELQAKAVAMGLGDDISFLGHRRDLREIMAVSDVTYSLSQQPESFGRVALEALAMGRAFVGYDHGGIGEQLRPAYPAGCVTLGDQAGLLAATLRVLKERPVPGLIGEPYTLDCMCVSTLQVYNELVTNP